MLKTIRILVALLAPANALAIPITVDFTVTTNSFTQVGSSYNGHDIGSVGVGSFTFDHDPVDFLETGTGLGISDLSFSWMGLDFDELDARLFLLDFDSDGSLIGWGIGATPCSLSCLTWPGPDDFYAAGLPTMGIAALHAEEIPGFAFGELRWSAEIRSVPEPGTLGLLALGLLGAAAARRRQPRASVVTR